MTLLYLVLRPQKRLLPKLSLHEKPVAQKQANPDIEPGIAPIPIVPQDMFYRRSAAIEPIADVESVKGPSPPSELRSVDSIAEQPSLSKGSNRMIEHSNMPVIVQRNVGSLEEQTTEEIEQRQYSDAAKDSTSVSMPKPSSTAVQQTPGLPPWCSEASQLRTPVTSPFPITDIATLSPTVPISSPAEMANESAPASLFGSSEVPRKPMPTTPRRPSEALRIPPPISETPESVSAPVVRHVVTQLPETEPTHPIRPATMLSAEPTSGRRLSIAKRSTWRHSLGDSDSAPTVIQQFQEKATQNNTNADEGLKEAESISPSQIPRADTEPPPRTFTIPLARGQPAKPISPGNIASIPEVKEA
jgi:hypothetical protein